MKFSEIAQRLTGISCPIFGVSWTAPEAEVTVARRPATRTNLCDISVRSFVSTARAEAAGSLPNRSATIESRWKLRSKRSTNHTPEASGPGADEFGILGRPAIG